MASRLPHQLADSLALSVKEACERSSIGRTTFYKLLRDKKITAHKCGRRTIVLPEQFQQELKSLPFAGSARPK